MHSSSRKVVELLQTFPWDDVKPIYERHGVTQEQGPQALVEQIERDGGNTFANLARAGTDLEKFKQGGIGVSYHEILWDCAQKMGINTESMTNAEDHEVEEAMLLHLVQNYLKDAPPQDREALQKALGELGEKQKETFAHLLRGGILAGSMMLLIRQVGQKAVTQALRMILLRMAGVEAGKTIGRIVGVAIPLLNVALAAYTAYELAGPASRKTIPTVIDIALLRLDQMYPPETAE